MRNSANKDTHACRQANKSTHKNMHKKGTYPASIHVHMHMPMHWYTHTHTHKLDIPEN